MKYLTFKKTTLSVVLTTFMLSTPAIAYESAPTKTIKGYYPSFNSVGTKVIRGDGKQLKVGDIIAIPSDNTDSLFFNLFDRDLDPALSSANGKAYDVAWWKVTPKEGYKWSDDQDTEGLNVQSWEHINAELISPSNYLSLPEISTSKALEIPPVRSGQRIAFSITPETEYGDPAKGPALYAPDLSFFWGNTDTDQKPGEPGDGSTDPTNPDGPGDGNETKPEGPNDNNGGGSIETVEVGTPIVHIYIDRDGNGQLDVGIDELLEDYPTVDTTYLADIKIVTEIDGEPALRPLTPEEEESISWNIINGDQKVSYSRQDGTGRVSDQYAFNTQRTNSDAGELMQSLPLHFSEQGTVMTVSFSIEGEKTPD